MTTRKPIEELTRKPNGYWKKEENILAEARKAMQQHGWSALPSADQLQKHGYSYLISAISRNHGGIQNIRTKLGQTNTTKPQGYWKKEENAIREALKIMKEQKWNTLPSNKELQKHGYTSLSVALNKYHGGIHSFRTKLGQTNSQKPRGYWQSLDNTITEAKQIMQEQGWSAIPTAKKLANHGYSAFSHALRRHHGGLNKFRTTLGQTNTRRSPGYWESLENVLAYAQQVMQQEGWAALPTARELEKHGYSSLNSAAGKYHGGLNQIRTTLGQTNTTKQHGYWQSLDNTITEAQQAMKKYNWNTLPTQKELYKTGCGALISAIHRHHGGINKFRLLLTEYATGKTQKRQLEELLDEYIAA